MKVARLPTGDTLEFPMHTPDDAIDQTVQAHMQEIMQKREQEKEAKTAEDEEKRKGDAANVSNVHHKEKMDYRQFRDRRSDMREGQERKRQDDWRAQDTQFRDQTSQAKAENSRQALGLHSNSNELLHQLIIATMGVAQRLERIEEAMKGFSEIGKSIEGMKDSIESAAEAVASKLGGDKKIIFDNRGRPIGMRVE